MKPMWRSVGLLLLGLALVAAGYAWRDQRARLEAATARQRQDSVLQAVTVQHARERDSLAQLRAAETARADRAEQVARQQGASAAGLKARADSLHPVLAAQATAADSLHVVLTQRYLLQVAYETLRLGFDSLLASQASLRRTVQLSDSLARLASTESALREKALRSLNDQLHAEIARLQGRGKFLGIVRIPGEVKLLGALYAGCRLARGCRVP